jgi:hypothetical protein
MPSEEQTRNANEARVKLAKEMVGYAKGRGWDMNELRAMAGFVGREDALPHLEEAWSLFAEVEQSDE